MRSDTPADVPGESLNGEASGSHRALWLETRQAIPRGMAFFLGTFSLLNLVGELRTPGFDANLWWINLPGNWRLLESAVLAWSAGCLLWFASHRRLHLGTRRLLVASLSVPLAASLWNTIGFYQILARGAIHSAYPIAFSIFVALSLAAICLGVVRSGDINLPVASLRYRLSVLATGGVCAVLFSIAQMICFGLTDYRRPADVVVVFGAKVYRDGSLSAIVEERVQTGCELYHRGLARHLVLSGGPGTGAVHETEGMRQRALALGVPDAALTLDRDGLDTDSTARNLVRLSRQSGWTRIMAVSQFFHLPRIKLAFHRRGTEVYTVPARRLFWFRALPYFMLREVAAWWLYYLRPLWEADPPFRSSVM